MWQSVNLPDYNWLGAAARLALEQDSPPLRMQCLVRLKDPLYNGDTFSINGLELVARDTPTDPLDFWQYGGAAGLARQLNAQPALARLYSFRAISPVLLHISCWQAGAAFDLDTSPLISSTAVESVDEYLPPFGGHGFGALAPVVLQISVGRAPVLQVSALPALANTLRPLPPISFSPQDELAMPLHLLESQLDQRPVLAADLPVSLPEPLLAFQAVWTWGNGPLAESIIEPVRLALPGRNIVPADALVPVAVYDWQPLFDWAGQPFAYANQRLFPLHFYLGQGADWYPGSAASLSLSAICWTHAGPGAPQLLQTFDVGTQAGLVCLRQPFTAFAAMPHVQQVALQLEAAGTVIMQPLQRPISWMPAPLQLHEFIGINSMGQPQAVALTWRQQLENGRWLFKSDWLEPEQAAYAAAVLGMKPLFYAEDPQANQLRKARLLDLRQKPQANDTLVEIEAVIETGEEAGHAIHWL